jgi:SAM-dependent methyltransferase
MTIGAAPAGWLSYDSVADIYERVAVPWFTALVQDLVAAAGPQPTDRVLDVGTGTGLAARATRREHPAITVVGVDPSPAMLSTVPADARVGRVVAMAPGLPFPPACFDVVLANLCVSHLRDPAVGLTDIARVTRAGGRFACTAWGDIDAVDGPGSPRAKANTVLEDTRAELGVDLTPPDRAAPWEEWFKDPDHLRAALTGAGFESIEISPHRSSWSFTIEEFLSGWGGDARYRRQAVGMHRWREYVNAASAALQNRVGDRIDITNVAWVAVGHRPPSRH